MNARTLLGALALLLAGCDFAPTMLTPELAAKKKPDAGEPMPTSEDASADAQDAAGSDAGEAGTDGGLDAQDAADADLDAMCWASSLGDGWAPGNNCGAGVALPSQCPACLPYMYNCGDMVYPAELVEAGAVMSPFADVKSLTVVCSNLAVCVSDVSFNNACPEAGMRAYDCPFGAADPSPRCIAAGFSNNGRCCP